MKKLLSILLLCCLSATAADITLTGTGTLVFSSNNSAVAMGATGDLVSIGGDAKLGVASGVMYVQTNGAAAGNCETLGQSSEGTVESDVGIARYDSSVEMAFRFTCTSNMTACGASILLGAPHGSPTMQLRLALRADNADTPGSVLGESAYATAAAGWFKANFAPGVSLASGTVYWLTVKANGFNVDNYWGWQLSGWGETSTYIFADADGTSWTVATAGELGYRIYVQ